MFYDPRTGDHGLPRNPFLSLVLPRPIGWISTRSPEGVANLAPYSFFNAFSTDPHVVGFSSDGDKDSLRNAEAAGCFIVNIVTAALAEAMNATSARVRPEVDEFALAGLTAVAGRVVSAPRVLEAPAALECVHVRTVPITGAGGGVATSHLVLGEVVGIHIDEAVMTDGFIDIAKLQPLARLGYTDYAVVRERFSMNRPAVVDG